MTSDNIREYIVCVNGGSGVIFQPADQEHTYILTAKHVLNDIGNAVYNGQINVHYFDSATNQFIAIPPFQPGNQNYFPHVDPNVDIAIIRVSRIATPNKQIFLLSLGSDRSNYSLAGFPQIRRVTPITINCIRQDDGLAIKGEREHNRREASLPQNQNYQELVGTSGAGIFKISKDYLLLAGIQNGMVNGNEALGNIEYTPISFFNQIANAENGLEEILPCYMKDFEFLRDQAFSLDLTALNEQAAIPVQNYLRQKAQDVINTGVTPKAIKTFFLQRLLVDETNIDSLYKSPIWVAWLEFLTIMNIVKYQTFNDEDLTAIFNSTRLKYIDYDKDWTFLCKSHLQHSDYHGLPIDGKVFISTPKDPGDLSIIKRGQIISIVRDYDKSKFKADSGIDPFAHYTFIHTSVLKKNYILDRLAAYANIENGPQLLNTLKEQYDELFG